MITVNSLHFINENLGTTSAGILSSLAIVWNLHVGPRTRLSQCKNYTSREGRCIPRDTRAACKIQEHRMRMERERERERGRVREFVWRSARGARLEKKKIDIPRDNDGGSRRETQLRTCVRILDRLIRDNLEILSLSARRAALARRDPAEKRSPERDPSG